MIARCDLAPLDGITKTVFRRVWARRFGGADRYFIPFFSPTPQHILTPRDRRELEMLPGLRQVPQVMTCRAEDFLWASAIPEIASPPSRSAVCPRPSQGIPALRHNTQALDTGNDVVCP